MADTFLKKEKVVVKPIVRTRPFFSKGHDGEFMFTGAVKSYMLPYSMSTRSFVNIFESKEEQEYFESEMGLKKGAMSVYDRNSAFWNDFKVDITKEGKTLDLSIPSHMLEYKVLKANKTRIAPSWDDRNKSATYEFALVSESQVIVDNIKNAERDEKAMELFMKIHKSPKKMYDILRVLGKKPENNAKDNIGWLKAQITEIIAEKRKSKGVTNVDDFIAAAEDPNLATKLFVLDAIDAGEITQQNGSYRLAANDQLLGKNMAQVVDYFKSPVGREDKLLIEQRLELNK